MIGEKSYLKLRTLLEMGFLQFFSIIEGDVREINRNATMITIKTYKKKIREISSLYTYRET